MALIWADGFDHYGTTPNGGRDAMLAGAWAAFTAGNGTLPAVSTTQKRTGTHSLHIQYNDLATAGVIARRVIGSTKAVVGMGMGVFFDNLPVVNNEHGMEIRNGANANIVRVSIDSDGSIGLYEGVGLTIIGSSDPCIGASSWNHIETKIIIDDIVGEVEVRVNGATVIHLTDLDLGTDGAAQFVWGNPSNGGDADLNWYLDDLVCWDDTGPDNNDFMGGQRVELIFATGDTGIADWVPVGDADGFDCIDNVPPDADSTYISAEDAGETSEFTLGTLPPETETIAAVYIPLMGKLEDAGVGNVQASLVSGVSPEEVSLGPDTVLTTAYTYWGGVHERDPATDAPWTKAGFEAARLRIEKTL
jgi:hypothetical protein